MPPIKTLSAADALRDSSSKSTLINSRAPKKLTGKTIAKPTTSALTSAQFLQVATKKSIKKRSDKSEEGAETKPVKATSTRSVARLSLLSSAVSTDQKRAQKVAEPKPVKAKTPQTAPQKKLIESKVVLKKTAVKKTSLPKTDSSKTDSLKIINVTSLTTPKTTKARRPRVPKDLATTYGENVKERAEIVPIKVRRARKTAQQREQRRALMTPDDDILQRLARSHTVSTSIKRAPKRHSKKWESRCGKCGVVTAFETNAALCSRCGAIAVRIVD